MKITVWVVTTCIPETEATTPCVPDVFTTEAAADAYLDEMMRREWETNGPRDAETDDLLRYPGDWRKAQDDIADNQNNLRGDGDSAWGEWQVTPHHVEIDLSDCTGLSAESACRRGLSLLQGARDLFKHAGARQTLDRVRRAITSAGGAVRHAQGKASRGEFAEV